MKLSPRPASRGSVRTAARVIAINVIVLFLVLVAIEVGLRLAQPDYAFYVRTEPGMFQDRTFGARHWPRKDRELGWVLNEGAPDFYKPEGLEAPDYFANEQGFRDPKNFTGVDRADGKTRVMVLGDSFVFGVHLDGRDTIPAMLERNLSACKVYNLGVPGWGLDQMYLAYQKYSDAIQPQVILLLYIDDDLRRIYEAFSRGEGMNKPSFSVEDGRLIERTPEMAQPAVTRLVIEHSIIANKLYVIYKNAEVRKLAGALFDELIAATRERGQQLIVVRLPRLVDSLHHIGPEVWSFRDFFAPKPCRYIELLDYMPLEQKYFIPKDEHFSAQGTAFVADFLGTLDVFRQK